MSNFTSTYNTPIDPGTGSQSWNLNPWLHSCRVEIWGGGGGGEFIAGNLIPTAGNNGGSSTIFGVTAGGGYGGGRRNNNTTDKGVGGNGGTVSITNNPNWSNLGVSITSISGTRGGVPDGGIPNSTSSSIWNSGGQGGVGSDGARTYVSNVYHEFDNTNDVTLFSNISTDISVGYINPTSEGNNGDRPTDGKYYSITFTDSFIDDTWTYSLTHAQMAAGGSEGGFPYSHSDPGFRNKTASGFNIWFETSGGGNTYIRSFELICYGIKSTARGRGGGGGSYATFDLTRQNLIDAGYDMEPYDVDGNQKSGDLLTFSVGSAGSATAGSGADGRVRIKWYEIPQVYLSANRTIIKTGESTQLSWYTVGDANALYFVEGNLTNQNINSFTPEDLAPTTTTTYTAEAVGFGGTSFNTEASVTIFVYQVPTIDTFEHPLEVDYGESQVQIEYDASYCDISLTLQVKYRWEFGPQAGQGFIDGELITINVDNVSPFDTGLITSTSGTLDINLAWDEWGPSEVQYTLRALGNGSTGATQSSKNTSVIIDTTPDNLGFDIVENSPDKLVPDQAPVTIPGVVLVEEGLLIEDIDIPVEVKSNYPIQITVNNANNWQNIREI